MTIDFLAGTIGIEVPQWSRLERGGVTRQLRDDLAEARGTAMEPPRKRRSDSAMPGGSRGAFPAAMEPPRKRRSDTVNHGLAGAAATTSPQWSRLERGGVTSAKNELAWLAGSLPQWSRLERGGVTRRTTCRCSAATRRNGAASKEAE